MSRFFKVARSVKCSPIALYAAILATFAVGLTASLAMTVGFLPEERSAWPLLGFALLAVIAERQSVRLTENIELSVAFLPLLFVAVVFGPLPAALIGAVTVLPDFGRPYTRWVIWTANRTIIGGMAGLAALLPSDAASSIGLILAATFLAAIVDFALDLILNTLTLVIRGTGAARDLARNLGPVALAGIPLYTSLVGLLAYSYIEVSPWT